MRCCSTRKKAISSSSLRGCASPPVSWIASLHSSCAQCGSGAPVAHASLMTKGGLRSASTSNKPSTEKMRQSGAVARCSGAAPPSSAGRAASAGPGRQDLHPGAPSICMRRPDQPLRQVAAGRPRSAQWRVDATGRRRLWRRVPPRRVRVHALGLLERPGLRVARLLGGRLHRPMAGRAPVLTTG